MDKPAARHDERDTMFARMARRPGTAAYDDYYAHRPELKKVDDRLRSLTPLLEAGSRYYEEPIAREADRFFEAIGGIEVDEGEVGRWTARLEADGDPTRTVKHLLLSNGAVAAG